MAYITVPVTFPVGTLMIPMDSTYQNNGMYKAYGLIFRLLYENIIKADPLVYPAYKPIYVYWAINPAKTTLTTVDFSATTKGYNTADATDARQYSGGPFIIQSDDLNNVKTLITAWNAANTPVVNIHEFTIGAIIDTVAKLIRPPKIAVEDKNAKIPIKYLNAAGLPDYYVLSGTYGAAPVWTENNTSVLTSTNINEGAFFGNTYKTSCQKLAYDIFISPHTDEGVWTNLDDTLPNLDEFLRLGGVLHSMCASIEAIENNAYFLTTPPPPLPAGINAVDQGDTFFIKTAEATNPLVQAVPTTNPQDLPGGSVETWSNSATKYKLDTKVLAYFIRNNLQYDFMVGGKYQGSTIDGIPSPSNTGAGAIVYEGGHEYTTTPYTNSQENMYTKFVLNSVFLSVTKPLIDLSMSPNPIKAGISNNLTFTVKNIGGAKAKNATISVTLLPGMNPSGYSILPNTTTGDLIVGFTLTWNSITLDGGEAITFAVNNYTPGAPGGFPIQFTATYGDEIFATGQNPYQLNACSTLAVLPSNSPFLLVNKKVDGDNQTFIKSGDGVVFTYTITNYGDQPAYSIKIVDDNLFNYFNVSTSGTYKLNGNLPFPTSYTFASTPLIGPTNTIVLDSNISIPASVPNSTNNVLTVTVNATHKGNSVVPPDIIINTAYVNYYNAYQGPPPDPNPNKTSPISNPATTNIVLPDISVVKDVDKANAAIGDILKYTIDITNPGNTVITQVKLTDLIPSGTSYVSGTLNVTTNISPLPAIVAQYIAVPLPERIEVTVTGNLNPIPTDPDTQTDIITVEFNVQVNSIPPNPIPNFATVDYSYKIGDQNTEDIIGVKSNTKETNIASLLLVKNAPDFVKLGQNLTYAISLTNNGKVALTNVKLIDTIPAGTSYVSVSGATFISQVGQVVTLEVNSIPINATANVTITVKVNTLPQDPYKITNIISAIYTVDGIEKPPITDDATTTVVEGKISVDKGTVGNISNAKEGDTVPYKVDITNTGNVPVTLTSLADVIQPVGYTTPNTTNIPLNITLIPQESTTITYNVLVTAVPPGTNPKIDNTVTISFTYPVGTGTESGTAQDSYTVNIQTPGILVKKDVDKKNAAIGDILTYTVEITNSGTVNIESIDFTDLIPTGTSYLDNSLNVTTNIVPAPIISKQYIPLPTPKVEVIATGIIKPITDKITITFQVEVDSIAQNPIENSSTVLFSYKVDPNKPSITETENSNIVETKVASLIVDKTSPPVAELGQNLTYTISLNNDGEIPLTNVKLVDTIPVGTSYVTSSGATFISQVGQVVTLQVNSIPINTPVNVTITVKVNTLPPAPSYTITNNVSVIYTVDGVEKPPVTDSADTDIVEGKIVVNKGTVGDITYAKVSDLVTYKVDITNIGNVPVTLTNLADVIQPPGYTTPNATNIPLSITLQPQISTTITYDVLITALPPNKKIDNTVIVDFTYKVGQTTVPGHGQDTFTLNIEEIKVSLTKAVDKTFAEPGEEIKYTFTINNQSSVPISNVYLYDPLPPNTSFVLTSFSLDSTQNPTQFPGAFIGIIPSNTQLVVSFKVKVDSNLTSSVNIPNKGSITYNYKLNPNDPGPGVPAGPVNSTEVNTKVEIAKIEIVKSIPPEQQYAEVGDIINYTITVKNTGTVNAYDVEVIDILPPELKFVGLLTVIPQQVGDTVSGTDPSYVKISIIRPNPNVVTIKFNAEVLSRPESGKIDNMAHGNFKYTLDPQKLPTLTKRDIPSNIVTTNIEEIKVELLKTANSDYVEVGQNLTYTVIVTNNSTVAVDIKFTDTLPAAVTKYVTGSFTLISGSATVINNTVPDSNLINLDINGMQSQSSVIFSYKVIVLSLPQAPAPPQITNAAKAVPFYKLFPGGPTKQGDPVTDQVTTDVKLIKIDAIKSVEETIATVGDTLHYTVRIINNGNVTAENVVFSDNVPDGTGFVGGSLTVNGVQVDSSPESGIKIGSILPGGIVTVKFNVKVIAIPNPPNPPKAENTALVTFDVELGGELQPREPVNSNPVETELKNVKLEAIKTVDKDIASVGDTLTYTVVIKNTGDVTINNVFFNDVIPEGTVLVGNQPVQNVNLGSIDPDKSKTVTFKVKIEFKPCPPKLINKATINGNYTIGTERKLTIESNEAITYVGIEIFKQISIDENLTIPDVKPNAEDILEVIASVEITYTNVIKTPIVTSYEGQQLTGWKLIVEGKLKQKIVYIADEPTQSVHAAEFEVPFSTFLVLPKEYKDCQSVTVVGVIEDIFFKLVDKRTIFKNVTLMLKGKTGC